MRLNSASTNGVSTNGAPLKYVLATVLAVGLSISSSQATVVSAGNMVTSGSALHVGVAASDVTRGVYGSAVSRSMYDGGIVVEREVKAESATVSSYEAVIKYYGGLSSKSAGGSIVDGLKAKHSLLQVGTTGTFNVEGKLGYPIELVAGSIVDTTITPVKYAIPYIDLYSTSSALFDNKSYKVTRVANTQGSELVANGVVVRQSEVSSSVNTGTSSDFYRYGVTGVVSNAYTTSSCSTIVNNIEQLVIGVVPTKTVVRATVDTKGDISGQGDTSATILANKIKAISTSGLSASTCRFDVVVNSTASLSYTNYTRSSYNNYVVNGIIKASSDRTALFPSANYGSYVNTLDYSFGRSLVVPSIKNSIEV